MKIGKNRQPSTRDYNSTGTDSDFASILYESKFEKFKPLVKVLVVIVILAGIGYGGFLYLNRGSNSPANNEYVPSSSQTTSDAMTDSHSTETTTPSGIYQNEQQRTNSGAVPSPSSSSTTSNYDPHKCDSLNNEATKLQTVADQKKATYDNAFAARKTYGYFYDKYGNSTEAQQAYNTQEAQLNQLQSDWKSALDSRNDAYSKYQECQSNNR